MNSITRIQYNAPVTLTYALLSLLVLGLSFVIDPFLYQRLFSVFSAPLTDPLTYWRMFSHVLGHANYAHFMGNFMLILLVGPLLEERYGAKWMIIMMVVTAFVTGVLHMIVSDAAKLGASGIVFMLILLSSFTNLQRGRVPLTLILVLGIFIGREVVAAASADVDNNIAYMSHIVGGLCGAMFGFIANKDIHRGLFE